MRKCASILMFFLAALSSLPLAGGQVKLQRSDIEIDFKEDGYYKTIPHIELANDLSRLFPGRARRQAAARGRGAPSPRHPCSTFRRPGKGIAYRGHRLCYERNV